METLELEIEADKKTMLRLYTEVFPVVARFVARRNGSLDDARDVFHDAVVIYLQQEKQIATSAEAYIFGISRHLWHSRFRQQTRLADIDPEANVAAENNEIANTKKLYQILATAGRKCLDLLEAFYFRENDLENITESMGYNNVHTASVQKHKCLQKIKSFVKSRSLHYEDFTE